MCGLGAKVVSKVRASAKNIGSARYPVNPLAEILHDPRQIRASLELTAWLVDRFHIRIRNVIGHAESLSSPYHKELYKPWAHQTHADWRHADMDFYRGKLRALLRADAGR